MGLPKILANLALLLCSLILFAVILELGLRLALPQNLVFTRFDPLLGHELMPGRELVYSNPQSLLVREYSHQVRINGQGMRDDREREIAEFPETYRIAVLGSSFTLGMGVELQESFPKLLENKLQEEFPEKRIEVLNFGVQNYNPEEQYLALLTKVRAYSPDLVVMSFPVTTALRQPRLLRAEGEEGGKLKYHPPSPPSGQLKLRQYFVRHSHAWSFAAYLMNSNKLTRSLMQGLGIFKEKNKTLFGVPDSEYYNAALQANVDLISRAAGFARGNGMGFLVAIIPLREQVDGRKFNESQQNFPLENFLTLEQPVQDLVRGLRDSSVPTISYLETMREENENNTFYYEIDGHWNQAGQRRAAEMLFEEVRKMLNETKQTG